MTPRGGIGDNRAWLRAPFTPLIIVGMWQLFSIAALFMCHAWTQQDLQMMNRSRLGQDFLIFYQGAEKVAADASPYAVSPYVTPPLPAQLLAPLTALEFERATRWFVAAVPLLLLIAIYLTTRWCWPESARMQIAATFATGLIMAAGFPYLFLFERGNIDALVALALFAAIAMQRRHAVIAGLLLAVAVSLKLYPALLLLPLVFLRQWRTLAAFAVGQLALIFTAPVYWRQFLDERLRWRMEEFYTVEENASIFNLFHFIGEAVNAPAASQWFAAFIYFALLAAAVATDLRRPIASSSERQVRLALYVPFMLAVPRVAYAYELVLLLPLLPLLSMLWVRSQTPFTTLGIVVAIAGVALAQTHIVAWRWLLDAPAANAVAALGLFLVMTGTVVLKWSPIVIADAELASGSAAPARVDSTATA